MTRRIDDQLSAKFSALSPGLQPHGQEVSGSGTPAAQQAFSSLPDFLRRPLRIGTLKDPQLRRNVPRQKHFSVARSRRPICELAATSVSESNPTVEDSGIGRLGLAPWIRSPVDAAASSNFGSQSTAPPRDRLMPCKCPLRAPFDFARIWISRTQLYSEATQTGDKAGQINRGDAVMVQSRTAAGERAAVPTTCRCQLERLSAATRTRARL